MSGEAVASAGASTRWRLATTFTCRGCGGTTLNGTIPTACPFVCPGAASGDGRDHVLARSLDPSIVTFPARKDPNPFLRYRELLHSYHLARSVGMSDAEYVALVERLDAAVASIDGRRFIVTPCEPSGELGEALGFAANGGVWVKDETGNVSGSHKGRHLFGVMLCLLVAEHADSTLDSRRPLAIASCGNAALAAATLARAANRSIDVFIPPSADSGVVEHLEDLGAHLTLCRRTAAATGDPCYRQFHEAVARGAVPFCCQGSDNAVTIEGGETIGYEMVTALGETTLDAIVMQVGGGALASACWQAFVDANRLGRISRLPRLHAVQTRGAFPLVRAYERVAARVSPRMASSSADRSVIVQDALQHAAAHRGEFMWPWEEEPRSVAHGILDDETYDWIAVVEGMLVSNGSPVVVDEDTLDEANVLARDTTGINVDHTGSAGLAGLMALRRAGCVRDGEKVAVIFSGERCRR
ncbi:MAG: pyridoxal-phosphate dependent enzyme [Acidobacteria bacterium]|nr:pyridoxal-phosphate dependent enzyme [Acidobacteriota bacterium]